MHPELRAATRRDFERELRSLVQLLQTEGRRLQLDAERLAGRGCAAFAGEILELRDRLDALRRQAEQLVTAPTQSTREGTP